MKPTARYFASIVCLALVTCCALARGAAGEDSPRPDWQNIAANKTVNLATPPNYPETSDAGDAKQLTDGKVASKRPIWYEGAATVGWMKNEPVEFIIDLGAIAPIRGAALRLGAGQAGADWPKEIKLLVSDDGKAFSPLGDVMKLSRTRPPAEGYTDVWLQADQLKTHGQFVKFIVTPTDTGAGCYVFIDEVEVYKGDDAFLKLPLPPAEDSGGATSAPAENIAAGAKVAFDTPPNYPETTDADDVKQLTDGAPATEKSAMWYQKSAVAWVGVDPVVITIDLGKHLPIRGAGIRFGAGTAGVEWPGGIQIYVSETGEKYSLAGDLMQMLQAQPPAGEYAAFWLRTDQLQTHGRFVKFICTPKNLGGGAYIVIDEIEIHRGDDAWLSQPLSSANAPDKWQADWNAIQWHDNADSIAEALRPTHVKLIDGKKESDDKTPTHSAVVDQDGVTFTLLGEATKPRAMTWTATLPQPISTEKCRYALLTYRAMGLQRTYEVRPLVTLHGISAQTTDNAVTLMEGNLPLNDGRSHTMLAQLPEGFTLQQIKVAMLTDDDAASLTIERFELLNEPPPAFGADLSTAAAADGMKTVDLSDALNGSIAGWFDQILSTYKLVIDGVRTMEAGSVTVSGVPFVIASGENNLAMLPQSQPSDERVKFLGAMADRQFLEPESRHDSLSVDVDARAREAFLLLAVSATPVQKLHGQASTALRLDDIEVLSVELTYDQGDSEIAFPYALAEKGCFIPARMIGAYAVAVDPSRTLKKITLHNRQYGPNFALAGVTLNTSDTPLAPELSEEVPPQFTKPNADPADAAPSLTHANNRIAFKNRWFECEIDLSQGFVIDKYVNRFNSGAPIELSDSAGLRVRVGNTIYTGRAFTSKVMKVSPTSVDVKLTSARGELPLQIDVTISADATPELKFVSRTTSTARGSAASLESELSLPALDGVSIADVAQTRIFFPQYRNMNTDQPIALRAPYGPEYPLQFFDIYNRAAGVGVMLRTDNAEQQMAHFALRKDDRGVSGGVWFPAEYNVLAPGQTRDHMPVSLIAHNGDWRNASVMYRDWVRTWYKPFRSQDKQYLLDAWEIACYRTSITLSWREQKTAPFISEDRTKFMTDEVFEFEKKTRGHYADLVHFYNWSYNDEKEANDYGVHSTPEIYKHVGGLEFFRQGIDDLQTRLNKPVSLYTVIDRFRASLVKDEALVSELVAGAWHQEPDKNSDASSHVRGAGVRDGTYFVRPGHEKWTDFVLKDIVKMQRDTGCKMVYIDVFSFWSHLAGENGVSPRQADLKVIKTLKEQLPPDVALWSEYPVTDVASQWHDGSLQYYFLHLSEVFARRHNDSDRSVDLVREMPINIARFILPRYKSIGLTAYIEASNSPSQPDAMFVNGDANQEDTWRLHHSRIRQKLNRAYEVKREYNDCFTSDNPMPHVDTAAVGIVANLFPSEGRNVWTLFNARPKTFSGVVLEIPHKDGATYRDAWNNVELSPTIENGVAKIALKIDPQQPGCVVQEHAK